MRSTARKRFRPSEKTWAYVGGANTDIRTKRGRMSKNNLLSKLINFIL